MLSEAVVENTALTFIVKCKAHIHKNFGRRKIVTIATLEQNDCKMLNQRVERILADTFCMWSLCTDQTRKP